MHNYTNSPRVVGPKSQHNIAIVRHGEGVLQRRTFELPMEETPSVQVECVLQTDLLDCGVGRSTHSDHIERIAVKMEWMTEIVLLNLVDQNDFNDGVQWDIDFVGAHAVGATVWWPVVAIAELVGVDVVELRENRSGR